MGGPFKKRKNVFVTRRDPVFPVEMRHSLCSSDGGEDVSRQLRLQRRRLILEPDGRRFFFEMAS